MQNWHEGEAIQEADNERIHHQVDGVWNVKILPGESCAEGNSGNVGKSGEEATREENTSLRQGSKETAIDLAGHEGSNEVAKHVS